MTDCTCSQYFRFEACDLKTGRIKSVLQPLSANWQTTLNQIGQGSLTVPTKSITPDEVFPNLTSIYITLLVDENGNSVDVADAEAVFAGMVDSLDAQDDDTTKIGMKSLEEYLNRRNINDSVAAFVHGYDVPAGYTPIPAGQEGKAVWLVNYARDNGGIPLSGYAFPSGQVSEAKYGWWERKNLFSVIQEDSAAIDGYDWVLKHTRDSLAGTWSTEMQFRMDVGDKTGQLIRSDIEASKCGLSVDGSSQATYVTGLGSGEESATMIDVESSGAGPYPVFDTAQAWKDVTVQETLVSKTKGYLADYGEPTAIPSATVPGLSLVPVRNAKNGDTVTVAINYGAIVFNGPARILSTSWQISNAAPERTFEFLPLTPPSQSVLNQAPSGRPCEDC